MIQKLRSTRIPAANQARSMPSGFQVAVKRPAEKDLPSLDFEVTLIDDWSQLRQRSQAWQRLADVAVESNVFYEPHVLLPALQHLSDEKTKVLIIEAPVRVCPDDRRILCGLFPIQKRRSMRGLPLSTLELWKHDFCFLTTPLVRQDVASETIEAFLNWTQLQKTSLVHFPLLPCGGQVDLQLVEQLAKLNRSRIVRDRHARAVLTRRETTGDVLKIGLSRKRRHEVKRNRRRLAELGQLQFEVFDGNEPVEPWVEQFLKLEATGWKGRQQTAIHQSKTERNFFESMIHEAAENGRLSMIRMKLDSETVALKVNLPTAEGVFCFKIAYSERMARFSPGVLLEIENIDWLHQEGNETQWMDSCAEPGHPMIEALWPDRRSIESVVIPGGRRIGNLAAASVPFFRALRNIRRR